MTQGPHRFPAPSTPLENGENGENGSARRGYDFPVILTVTFGNCRRRLVRAVRRAAVVGEWLRRAGFAQRGEIVAADPFDRGVDIAEALACRLEFGAPGLVRE